MRVSSVLKKKKKKKKNLLVMKILLLYIRKLQDSYTSPKDRWLFLPQGRWYNCLEVFLPLGFFRQAYWNGLPFPPPEILPYPGIKPTSPVSRALQVDS